MAGQANVACTILGVSRATSHPSHATRRAHAGAGVPSWNPRSLRFPDGSTPNAGRGPLRTSTRVQLSQGAVIFGSYVDELLAILPATGLVGDRKFVHSNHLYSVAALTDNSGAVIERYRYDAYGQRTVLAADGVTTRSGSSYGNQYGFTGRYLDKETGLWYFRARYYSGSLGGFVSRDDWHYIRSNILASGYSSGLGLYASYFVPNRLDPTGNRIPTPPVAAPPRPLPPTPFPGPGPGNNPPFNPGNPMVPRSIRHWPDAVSDWLLGPSDDASDSEPGDSSDPQPEPPGGGGGGSGDGNNDGKKKCCKKDYADVILCQDLDYPFGSKAEAVAEIEGQAAILRRRAMSTGNGGGATGGPCAGALGSWHETFGFAPHPRFPGNRIGSIVACRCCVDTPAGPVIRRKWDVVW